MENQLKTLGISPKAILAFVFPVIAAAVLAVVAWINGDVFDVEGIKIALGGVILAGLSALGAYLGRPGDVVDKHDA